MTLRFDLARWEIGVFLFLALFSNLLGRIFGTGIFNVAYYVVVGVVFIDAVRFRAPNRIDFLVLGLMAFFAIYILDWRSPFSLNLLTIKDIIVPLTGMAIGLLFARHRRTFINYLGPLYLVFVGYAVLQEIAFYTLNLSSWLPWDDAYVSSLLESGAASNLYQGGLLRFFGPMNSFAEGQIFVVVLGLLIVLFRADLRHRWLFYLNMILGLTFVILAFERSAILMAVVILAFWLLPALARRLRYVVLGGIALPLLALAIGAFAQSYIREDPALSYAYDRLLAAVTLDFSGDEALRDRAQGNWQQAMNLAREEYFGIGPGRVTPSASGTPDYVGPHNNYLLYHLAYGVVGLLGFLIVIAQALESFRVGRRNVRFFGYGLIAAYGMLAFFNLPFASRSGTMFFTLLGLLLAGATVATRGGRQVVGSSSEQSDQFTAHSA